MQRWAFCLEQTLGHRAHSQNLERSVGSSGADVDVHHVDYQQGKLPLPWAVRGSMAARQALETSGNCYDVAFYHTQTVSLLAHRSRAARRYVVSVDATPVQMDAIGAWYSHARGRRPVEWGKSRWYRQVFARSAGVVAWSRWAADSLNRDYGVPEEKIIVAHPGAPAPFFAVSRSTQRCRPRILFVGGDFERKGGAQLLEAYESVSARADLLIVSDAQIVLPPGAEQESGVSPASERLLDAYARSDIFCLPTLADCTPVVLGEAMAAGLPVVTTHVGSNSETVADGDAGFVVEPGDARALAAALEQLVDDATLRMRMGAAARATAEDRLSADRNAAALFDFLRGVA